MKLFDSFLDWTARISATRANSRGSLVVDTATALALLAAAAWHRDLRILPALGIVVAGILLFSLVEYCFHRWLFHDSRSLFVMEDGHRKHHENPQGDDTLPFFLPPAILLCLAGLFALAMPTSYALLLAGVIGSGYAVYGLSHFAMHVRRFRHPLIRQWAAHHHIHHHHPDKNFGVTSPLWDIVLGTRYESKSARIPLR
jgi:sterol desaturase/sphingolipid hydroxylase (fatty acid hydroxylase superfamily)